MVNGVKKKCIFIIRHIETITIQRLAKIGPTFATSRFLPISVVGYFTVVLWTNCTLSFLSKMPVK